MEGSFLFNDKFEQRTYLTHGELIGLDLILESELDNDETEELENDNYEERFTIT